MPTEDAYFYGHLVLSHFVTSFVHTVSPVAQIPLILYKYSGKSWDQMLWVKLGNGRI